MLRFQIEVQKIMNNVKRKPKIAVIIPAYNEGAVIGHVIRSLRRTLESAALNSDIIVVNDGSTDNTAIRAQQAGAHVISHLINTGSGGATTSGLAYAKKHNYYIAVTVDGDGQHHPKDVLAGIQLLLNNKGIDLLIGSRIMSVEGMPKMKIYGNKGLGLITFCLFGVRITDTQSGLRVFSNTALHTLKWKTYGYGFCSEMIWRAKQQQLAIREYPVKAIYTDYSKAKGQSNWNAVHIVRSLLKWRIVELFGE